MEVAKKRWQNAAEAAASDLTLALDEVRDGRSQSMKGDGGWGQAKRQAQDRGGRWLGATVAVDDYSASHNWFFMGDDDNDTDESHDDYGSKIATRL